eukprot:2888837-Pleurochrysis_carterae.AAC.3
MTVSASVVRGHAVFGGLSDDPRAWRRRERGGGASVASHALAGSFAQSAQIRTRAIRFSTATKPCARALSQILGCASVCTSAGSRKPRAACCDVQCAA